VIDEVIGESLDEGVWSRVGPLLRVLEAAAGTDEELAQLRRQSVTVERATDLLWTICAQANYDALATARGWSHSEYRDWLTDALVSALLPDAS
jgi:hypothetical protein